MDVVDVSPQSTIRSWTCNDVKTWPKNVELKDRLVVECFFIVILIQIPKRKLMLSIATLPWKNEIEWHTTIACPQVLRQVSTTSFPGSFLFPGTLIFNIDFI